MSTTDYAAVAELEPRVLTDKLCKVRDHSGHLFEIRLSGGITQKRPMQAEYTARFEVAPWRDLEMVEKAVCRQLNRERLRLGLGWGALWILSKVWGEPAWEVKELTRGADQNELIGTVRIELAG